MLCVKGLRDAVVGGKSGGTAYSRPDIMGVSFFIFDFNFSYIKTEDKK